MIKKQGKFFLSLHEKFLLVWTENLKNLNEHDLLLGSLEWAQIWFSYLYNYRQEVHTPLPKISWWNVSKTGQTEQTEFTEYRFKTDFKYLAHRKEILQRF